MSRSSLTIRTGITRFRVLANLAPEVDSILKAVRPDASVASWALRFVGSLDGKIQAMPQIRCTSCHYCCVGCPVGIKIPDVFRGLNMKRLYPDDFRVGLFYNGLIHDSGKASDCIGCGQCERVCPQHLPVMELMKEAAEKLE